MFFFFLIFNRSSTWHNEWCDWAVLLFISSLVCTPETAVALWWPGSSPIPSIPPTCESHCVSSATRHLDHFVRDALHQLGDPVIGQLVGGQTQLPTVPLPKRVKLPINCKKRACQSVRTQPSGSWELKEKRRFTTLVVSGGTALAIIQLLSRFWRYAGCIFI